MTSQKILIKILAGTNFCDYNSVFDKKTEFSVIFVIYYVILGWDELLDDIMCEYYMMRLMRLIGLVIGVLVSGGGFAALGQTSFKMEKKQGHYYTSASINGHADTPALIETGYPAMTMSLDRYNELLSSLPLEEIRQEQTDWLSSDQAKHRILKKLRGKYPWAILRLTGSFMWSNLTTKRWRCR